MLNFDSLYHISTFCNFKTRIQFKLSCKNLNSRILIQLLEDETVITKEFMENTDNCWIFFEYFLRTFIIPHETDEPEPYLTSYNPELKQGKVFYGRSPYHLFYEQEIIEKEKEESFRSHVKSQEVKFFEQMKDWFEFEDEDDEDDDDVGEPYNSLHQTHELWYNVLGSTFDYNYPCCVGYKLNPKSPRINCLTYVGDFFGKDFDEDCISFEY